MTLKSILRSAISGMMASLIIIIVVIDLGINTDAIVFGADKFTIWLIIFLIGITTAISTEVVSGSSAKEVLFDTIVAAVVATVVINRDLSWFSYSEYIEAGIQMFKQNLWVVASASLSTSATKLGDRLLSHKFGKNE